jgi:uncharacterized membrane protein YecN with MAPEG domain
MTPAAFRREQRGVALAMAAALVTAILVLGGVVLAERGGAPMPVAARLAATLRIEAFVVVWLVAAIANVARLRFFSARDIAGSGAEGASDEVRWAGAILQNTVEQVALAVVVHLIVAASIDRPVALVAALAALFGVGRLLFWAGYRHGASGRAFGFALTFYPSVLALLGSGVAVLIG